jgi:predicted NBD/HSP70 family sugar kinase
MSMQTSWTAGGPATSATVRELNLRTVWGAIGAHCPISRAEIARLTGISKPTVSAVLEELLAIGLVAETTDESRGFTYGAVFFAPRPAAAYALGFDVGARHLRGVLAGLDGAPAARLDVDVAGLDAAAIAGASGRLAEDLARAAGVDRAAVRHAVVGVPGVVDRRDGRVWQALNVPGMDGFDARSAFAEATGMPVTVENDIHLAALGEQSKGTGGAAESFVFLSVGTGVGAGLVLGNVLHRGFKGAAGEIDNAFDEGSYDLNDPCAQAILEYAARVIPGEPSTEQVFGMARGGDPVALQVVDDEARRIASYAAVVSAVVDVELVVLGGGIGLNGDLLLDRVRRHLDARLPYPPRVEVSALGDGAVLVGAAAVGASAVVEQIIGERFR